MKSFAVTCAGFCPRITTLKDGATKRAIIGFYGEADGTFVFAWTEAHARWMGDYEDPERWGLVGLLHDFDYERFPNAATAADAEPAGLYPSGDGSFEFQRTVSRLEEMRSAEYLAEGHGLSA